MRIDVIVPNFDQSSSEIIMSSWYKQIGDKISKNEIIADAETDTVACGITSGYDCVLANILVGEGDTVSPGDKIAVIETDLSSAETIKTQVNKNASKGNENKIINTQNHVAENASSISNERKEQENHGSNIKNNSQNTNSYEQIHGQETAGGIEKNIDEQKQKLTNNHDNNSADEKNSSRNNYRQHSVENNGLDTHNNSSDNKNFEKNRNGSGIGLFAEDEYTSHSEEFVTEEVDEAQALSLNDKQDATFIESVVEEDEALIETLQEKEHKVIERSEESVVHIFKKAEESAREEASKIKQAILNETKDLAILEAEDIKIKIIKSAEESASDEASRLHSKMLKTTLEECENTKRRLIEETKEKAKIEAEALYVSLIKKAEDDAREKAIQSSKYFLEEAKIRAREDASEISKNILERAITEAKTEAKSLKKDIIHSSQKHAAKKAVSIFRETIVAAQKQAKIDSDDLIKVTQEAAIKETQSMLELLVQHVQEKIDTISSDIVRTSSDFLMKEINIIANNTITKTKTEIEKNIKDTIAALYERTTKEAEAAMLDSFQKAKEHSKIVADGIIAAITGIATKEAADLKSSIIKDEIANAVTSLKSTIHDIKNEEKCLNKVIKQELFAEKALDTQIINKTIEEISNTSNNFEEELANSVVRVEEENIDSAICADSVMINSINSEINKKIDNIINNEMVESYVAEASVTENVAPQDSNVDANAADPSKWNKSKYFINQTTDELQHIDLIKKRLFEKNKTHLNASVISTVSNEVDMSEVIALGKTFGKDFSKRHNTRLGFTPFFVLASINALKKFPVFNAHIIENYVIYKDNFDISIIAAGNTGLVAPVIRNADKLSIAEIEKQMIQLSNRAMEGTLLIEEASDGTFTVINAGEYGSIIGTELITPPQVAALGVHKMVERPIATPNGVQIKPMLYLSLSYDYRISDTKIASSFLELIKNYVEHPGWQGLGI